MNRPLPYQHWTTFWTTSPEFLSSSRQIQHCDMMDCADPVVDTDLKPASETGPIRG